MNKWNEPISVLSGVVGLALVLVTATAFMVRLDTNANNHNELAGHQATVEKQGQLEKSMATQTAILERVEQNQKDFKGDVRNIEKKVDDVARKVGGNE